MKRMLFGIFLCVSLIIQPISTVAVPPDSEYNISDMESGNILSETQMGDFTIIPATDGNSEVVKIDNSKKTGSVTKLHYTKRLKTGASGSYTNRAIRFSVTGPAVLYIDCCSANKTDSRTGKIIDSGNNVIESKEMPPGVVYYKFLIDKAGDYAFVSEGGGINVYYLKLSYTLPEPDPDFEDLNPVIGEQMSEIYTAPLAPAQGKGTEGEPMSIASAIANIAPGGTIHCKGRYMFGDCLTIPFGNSGAEGAEKHIDAPDGTVFDFSHEPYSGNGSPRGFQIDGSYWYIKGIEVYMAADNGFYITGNHNTLELCRANANRDTGIQISRRDSSQSDPKDWPSDNLILNCTSYNSFDPDTGENADGFAAKLTCGTGNVFDGCIAYNNCDDGWDCYTKSETGPIGPLVFRNCVSFRNGQTTDGNFTDNSDGNGFKMGGEKIAVSHQLYNCISFENANHGFTDNSNPGPIYLYNCTSFNNSLKGGTKKSNFDFARDKTNSNNTLENCLSYTATKIGSDKFLGTIKNSAVYNNKGVYYYYEDFPPITDWNDKLGEVLPSAAMDTVTESVFVSVEPPPLGADVHTLWREADGSIALGDFLKVAEGTVYKEKNMGANLSGSDSEKPVPTPRATASPSEKPNPAQDFVLSAVSDANNEGTYNISLENNTENRISAYVTAAAYKVADDADVLVSAKIEPITVDALSKGEVNITLDIPLDTGEASVKIYAWSDPVTMIPITEPIEPKPSAKSRNGGMMIRKMRGGNVPSSLEYYFSTSYSSSDTGSSHLFVPFSPGTSMAK